MSKSTKKCLFEELYNATPDEKKNMEYPYALRAAKLKLQTAFLNAQVGLSDAEKTLRTVRSEVSDLNLIKVLSARTEVTKHQNTLEFIKSEYEELFGETLNPFA